MRLTVSHNSLIQLEGLLLAILRTCKVYTNVSNRSAKYPVKLQLFILIDAILARLLLVA